MVMMAADRFEVADGLGLRSERVIEEEDRFAAQGRCPLQSLRDERLRKGDTQVWGGPRALAEAIGQGVDINSTSWRLRAVRVLGASQTRRASATLVI
ncbi:hypothetical protein KAX17_12240 [Candidatus Bipolaricaulota bacterium]|nr:hypothetical protein [Candidatus Bipolaricaulota bacterium]